MLNSLVINELRGAWFKCGSNSPVFTSTWPVQNGLANKSMIKRIANDERYRDGH